MAILYFKGLSAIYCYEICHIRAFLRHFWGKTQKVLSKKAFFRFKVWGFQSFFVTSPSMRKKLRPDVASDTSRRNNNCVATQPQIRRDENEGTNSHDDNIWQFPALFRELPYVFYAEYQSFTHII